MNREIREQLNAYGIKLSKVRAVANCVLRGLGEKHTCGLNRDICNGVVFEIHCLLENPSNEDIYEALMDFYVKETLEVLVFSDVVKKKLRK